MQTRVIRPQELSEGEVALWRSWQRADERLASPFLAPEFVIAFGRHFDGARVAVVNDGLDTVAIFPFELLKRGVARSLGFDLSDVQAVLCASDTSIDFAQLLEDCSIAVWEFDHLASHQIDLIGAAGALREPAPAIDLTHGYDAWLAERRAASSSRMKKAVQKRRKLEREVGDLSFVFDSQSPVDLAQLMAWKADQYVRTGRSDRFSDPRFRAFVEDLVSIRTDDFQMQLSRLDAGDKVAGLYLSLRANNRLAGWFPTYNPELSAWSPGMACMLELVQAAAAEGLTCLELGEGAADYKESFKSFDFEVAEGRVERPVLAAKLRRAQTAPKRAAMRVVLGNEHLRLGARAALKGLGKIRAAASAGHSVHPPV